MPRAKGQTSLAKNQLQLAIALSSSLEESKTRELSKLAEELTADAIEDGAVPHNIKQMQKEFLERLQPKPISGPARRTRKVVSAAIPTLLSRSSEERLRIITEKVALVLIQDDNETDYAVTQARKSSVQDEELYKESILWQKASEVLTENDRQSYYVDSLSVYLCPEQSVMSGDNCNQELGPGERSPAPLDENHDEFNETCFWEWLSPRWDADMTGAFVLQLDWARLVNLSVMSDVTIVIKGQEELCAHKLVFTVRAPKLLEELGEGNQLQWPDVTRSSALYFLAFVYTGRHPPMQYAPKCSFVNLCKKYGFRVHVSEERVANLDDDVNGKDKSLEELQQNVDSIGDASTDLFADMDEPSMSPGSLVHQQGSLPSEFQPADKVCHRAVSRPSSEQLVNRSNPFSTDEVIVLDSDDDDDGLVRGFFGSSTPILLSPVSSYPKHTCATRAHVSPRGFPSGAWNAAARRNSVGQYCAEQPLDMSMSSGRVSITPDHPKSLSTSSRALSMTPREDITAFVRRDRDGERSSQDVEVIVLDDDIEVPVSKQKLGGSAEKLNEGTAQQFKNSFESSFNCANMETPQTSQENLLINRRVDEQVMSNSPSQRIESNEEKKPVDSQTPVPPSVPLISHEVGTDRDGERSSQDGNVIVLDDDLEVSVSKRKLEGSEEEELVDGPNAKKPCKSELPPWEGCASPNLASFERASLPRSTPEGETAHRFENSFESSFNYANMETPQTPRENLLINRRVDEQVLSNSPSQCIESHEEKKPVPTPPLISHDEKLVHSRTPSPPLEVDQDGMLNPFDCIINENDSYMTRSEEIKLALNEVTFESPLRTPLTDVKSSSPVTPMPDYGAMSVAQFQENLLKFGLKGSLTRDKGIRLMQHIYNQLHPQVKVLKKRGKELFIPLGDKPPSTATATLPLPRAKSPTSDEVETEMIYAKLTPSSSSSDEDEAVAEESGISHPDAEQGSSQGNFDLKEELQKWIAGQPELHEQSLQYEPLFLNTIFVELRKHLNGNRGITLQKLMHELDRSCIMFRAMQQEGGNSRRRKSPKKASKKDTQIPDAEDSD